MGEEESQVEQAIAPGIDLGLADARPVRYADLCGLLLAEVASSAYLELLR